MELYVSKMEETLLQKDELLESIEGEFDDQRAELQSQLDVMREELKNVQQQQQKKRGEAGQQQKAQGGEEEGEDDSKADEDQTNYYPRMNL